MSKHIKAFHVVASALILAAGAPAVAQMGPPPSHMHGPGPGPGPDHGPHERMFGNMSGAGRKTMMQAMRGADPRADGDATNAARDRMLTILDADKLDVPALKAAMDEERAATTASRIRHQAAMLEGFQKLSVADRKAFVDDARAMRARMMSRMNEWKQKGGDRGMPPPPPM